MNRTKSFQGSRLQVKGTTIVVLVFMVAVVSVALTVAVSVAYAPMPTTEVPDMAERFQTSISVWKNGTDTILDITIGCPRVHPECDITADVVEVEIDGVSQLLRLVWWEVDPTQMKWLIIVNVTAPYSVDCPLTYDEFDADLVVPAGSMVVPYNMGEVTGKPLVRARTHMFYVACTMHGGHWEPCYSVGQYWDPWSPMIEAVPPQPLPLIEIASVIGVAGIAIAVGNNYLQGRREQKATEVTRTVAVDERFMELYNTSRETEFQRTMAEVLYQYQWADYTDFQSKYGPQVNVDAWAKVQSLAQYFEGVGVLVQTESVDLDQVLRLLSNQIVEVWEKLEEVILERRRRELNPTIYGAFEALYYAVKKQQQEGPPQPDEGLVHKFE